MRITQPSPHYIQSNSQVRQNAHINSQLIKNNQQTVNTYRSGGLSPQPISNMQAVSFHPIQMTNNQTQIRSQVMKTHVMQQQPRIGNFIPNGNMISAPGPQMITKMQPVNRSNSASRIVSQSSRIQYLNIAGDSGKNSPNINQISVNTSPNFQSQQLTRIASFTMPQFYQNTQRNMGQMTGRPPSNISNNSSQSKISVQSRPISNTPIVINQINQSRSVDNQAYRAQENKKPISPARIMPTQPPQRVGQMPTQITFQNGIPNQQQQQFRPVYFSPPHLDQHNQYKIAPQPQPQAMIPQAKPQTPRTNQNEMRTSDVRVVYQRGSFSPNQQHSSNQEKDRKNTRQNIEQRRTNPIKQSEKKIQVQKLSPRSNNSKSKISIASLKQKSKETAGQPQKQPQILQKITSTAIQSIIQPNRQLVFKQINPVPQIRMDANQKISVKNTQQNVYKAEQRQIVNDYPAHLPLTHQQDMLTPSLNMQIQPSPFNQNSKQIIQARQNNQASPRIMPSNNSNSINNSLSGIPQNYQKTPTFSPLKQQIEREQTGQHSSQIYRDQAVKSVQSRNIILNSQTPINSQVIGSSQYQSSGSGQAKKVYKSYDQYLQQTRKPQKVITQLQQSQNAHISIEYRQEPALKTNPPPPPSHLNTIKQALPPPPPQTNKQAAPAPPMNPYGRQKKSVYQSIPIPTIYGNLQLDNEDDYEYGDGDGQDGDDVYQYDKQHSRQNRQNRQDSDNNNDIVSGSIDNYYGYANNNIRYMDTGSGINSNNNNRNKIVQQRNNINVNGNGNGMNKQSMGVSDGKLSGYAYSSGSYDDVNAVDTKGKYDSHSNNSNTNMVNMNKNSNIANNNNNINDNINTNANTNTRVDTNTNVNIKANTNTNTNTNANTASNSSMNTMNAMTGPVNPFHVIDKTISANAKAIDNILGTTNSTNNTNAFTNNTTYNNINNKNNNGSDMIITLNPANNKNINTNTTTNTNYNNTNTNTNNNNTNTNNTIINSPLSHLPTTSPNSSPTLLHHNMDGISAIRQHSHEQDHQYSSSLIGQSLQQNLKHSSSNMRQLSSYQPDSRNNLYTNNNTNNTANVNNIFGNILGANILGNINNNTNSNTNNNNKNMDGNVVNPFTIIQQQLQLKQQQHTHTNTNGNNNRYAPQNMYNAVYKPNHISNDGNVMQGWKTEMFKHTSSKDYHGVIAHSVTTRAHDYNNNNMSNNISYSHKQISNQHYPTNNNNPSKLAQQQYSHIHTHKSISEKVIPTQPSQYLITDRIPINNRPRSNNIPTHRHYRKSIQNEQDYDQYQPEGDSQSMVDMGVQVYDLIDDIFNRQLQDGLKKINQTYGRAMNSISADMRIKTQRY